MRKRLILFLFSLLFSGLLGMSLMAQEATTTTTSTTNGVTVEGPVSSINGNVVIVGDVAFELADSDPLLATLQIGQMVRIQSSGDPDDDGALDAVTVIVTGSPLSAATVNVVGAVESIQLNVVTVAGYQIQFDATDPMLNNINVGDVIEVSGTTLNLGGVIVIVPSSVVIIIIGQPDATTEPTVEPTPESTAQPGDTVTVTGALTFVDGDIWVSGYKIAPNGAFQPSDYDDGQVVTITGILLPDGITIQASGIELVTAEPTPEVTPDRDDDDDDIIIVIEGPVEAINININTIIVYGFEIKIDRGNAIWTDLEIGDIVRLEGEWLNEGTTIVIVVVNIIIIQPPVIIIPGNNGGVPAGCKVSKDGRVKCSGRGSRSS